MIFNNLNPSCLSEHCYSNQSIEKPMQQLTKLTDSNLVEAYANGNNEAFDVLLERHKQKIYSYIFHIVKNKDLADDIFQETFVKVIVTIKQGRYSERNRFSAWLTRIAHNLIIDNFRQEKVAIQVNDDLRNLVMSLPDPQREVVVLRYYRDMSFKEIAEATGVSINTALGRMRYAILNIRRLASEKNISLAV